MIKKYLFLIPMLFLMFTGCTPKVIVEPVYIKTKMPLLEVYENNSSLSLGTVYNDNGNVCITKWSACIPKTEMVELINYTTSLKETISKYKTQTTIYNNRAEEHNKED